MDPTLIQGAGPKGQSAAVQRAGRWHANQLQNGWRDIKDGRVGVDQGAAGKEHTLRITRIGGAVVATPFLQVRQPAGMMPVRRPFDPRQRTTRDLAP